MGPMVFSLFFLKGGGGRITIFNSEGKQTGKFGEKFFFFASPKKTGAGPPVKQTKKKKNAGAFAGTGSVWMGAPEEDQIASAKKRGGADWKKKTQTGPGDYFSSCLRAKQGRGVLKKRA